MIRTCKMLTCISFISGYILAFNQIYKLWLEFAKLSDLFGPIYIDPRSS